MKPNTIVDYQDRIYQINVRLSKIANGLEVGSPIGSRVSKISEKVKKTMADLIGDNPDDKGLPNRLNSLERSVDILLRGDPEESEEESTLPETLQIPVPVADNKTFVSIGDMVQEICNAQASLLSVYNYACQKNPLAPNANAFMALKSSADILTDVMRKIAALGGI